MTHGAHVSSPQCSTSSREAEGLHRRALEGKESQLGPQHPSTLASVNNLAMLLKKQGKLEEARLRSSGYTEVTEVSRWRQFSSGQDKGLVSFLFPSFTGVKAKLMKGRARVANSWNCFSGIQASAVDTRLGLIRLTGLLDLNSSTCILCKGRSTLSSKKWNLVARFYLELWLMHWQCVPASRSTRKAFTLASWFPPSYPMQIRFWQTAKGKT